MVILLAVVTLIVTSSAAIAVGVRRALLDGRSEPSRQPALLPQTVAVVATGNLRGAGSGEFTFTGNAVSLTVRLVDLGEDAYRVGTPEGSNMVPKATVSDAKVSARLVPSGDASQRNVAEPPTEVDIRLDRRITWMVKLNGGGTAQTLDLSGGQISALELLGGTTATEITLPQPKGAIPVRVLGGNAQVTLHAPSSVPVRVTIGSGAGTLNVDGVTKKGLGPGTVVAPPGWGAAANRYDFQVVGGASVVTVDRR